MINSYNDFIGFRLKFGLMLLSSIAWVTAARAQNFKLMRYDEDYSVFRDSSSRFYTGLKFHPLSADKKYYLSIGGEVREEYDAFTNEDWGKNNSGQVNFLLQRYDLHADWHLGNNVRVFTQLRSALENGRPTGPRPIDEDKLNIQNLFIDASLFKRKNDSLTVRVGRQELNYGAGRLISVREGPNARLYFTGLKFLYRYKGLSVDAFAMEADNVKPGVFDNTPTRQINLWAAYSTLSLDHNKTLELYYIGYHKYSVIYDAGTGNELRHTIGTRLLKTGKGLTYDIEAAYQFGQFNNGTIDAWTASFDFGYVFLDLTSQPAIGLRNDYISGNGKNSHGSLQTFNPIYPKGGYFGFDPQVGPVNLIDIHPYASIFIAPKVSFLADIVFNWRYSLNDGIYRPSGSFNLTGLNSDKRFIGTDYLAKVLYTINPFVSIYFGIQYFVTGSFIDSEIPNHKNAILTNTRIAFKF